MAISVQDLDQLLGYDPATHSVAGIPAMKSALPHPGISEAGYAIGSPEDKMATAHPSIPKAATSVPAAPEVAGPSIPSVDSAQIPALARPTPKQSVAAGMAQNNTNAKTEGKNQFEQMMPQVTAAPLTPEYFQQQRAVSDYEKAHPYGADISAKPGLWGKIEHGLAKAGNIAGNIVDPAAMAAIPGTDLYKAGQRGAQMRGFNSATEDELKQQQTAASKTAEAATEQGNEPTPWTPMGSTTPMMVPFKSIPTLEAAETRAQATEQAAETKNAPALAKLGYKMGEDGNMVPIPDDKLSPQQKQARELTDSVTKFHEAQAAALAARNDPNSVQSKQSEERLKQAQAELQEKWAGLGVKEKEAANKAAETGRKQDQNFEKAYVQPAETVEKSYQMMNDAYNEYKAAKEQGKSLPTGAQSMLALSTHLSTTFGNVKGARITKDMIEHHLGARGISDSALVAIQKLTNGDVLSPQQWDAFHDLIGKSRELSWKTAVKEAGRANQPVNFLPEDLKALGGEATPAAAPAGAGASPKKGDPLGIF